MAVPYRGPNRYRTLLKAGRNITGKIARLGGAVGVLGTGALGRRFGDRYSDLDLTVYAHAHAVRRLRRLVSIGWISFKGVEFDIVVVPFETAEKAGVPSRFWTQVRRWDHQNSQILCDNRDRIKKLLAEKLVYPDAEQERLLARYRDEVHEHLVFFPELWAERGQLYNVFDALVGAVKNIVLWIYAKNKVFEPYLPKWLFYHLENRTVPEHVYLDSLISIYTRPVTTIAGAMRVRDDLLKLCERIGLDWDVYSVAEAHERAVRNWRKVPEESKRLLSW